MLDISNIFAPSDLGLTKTLILQKEGEMVVSYLLNTFFKLKTHELFCVYKSLFWNKVQQSHVNEYQLKEDIDFLSNYNYLMKWRNWGLNLGVSLQYLDFWIALWNILVAPLSGEWGKRITTFKSYLGCRIVSCHPEQVSATMN